jgi:NADH dehydrogenase FAD-containing subunit
VLSRGIKLYAAATTCYRPTQRMLKDLYKDLDLSKAQTFLVDMGHSVLSTFSQKSQEYASSMLKQLTPRLL